LLVIFSPPLRSCLVPFSPARIFLLSDLISDIEPFQIALKVRSAVKNIEMIAPFGISLVHDEMKCDTHFKSQVSGCRDLSDKSQLGYRADYTPVLQASEALAQSLDRVLTVSVTTCVDVPRWNPSLLVKIPGWSTELNRKTIEELLKNLPNSSFGDQKNFQTANDESVRKGFGFFPLLFLAASYSFLLCSEVLIWNAESISIWDRNGRLSLPSAG
jgi:hypothetical protein